MMHCSTTRHALSECLDGRLPSGRRTEVMAHVARCDECAQFWQDLQELRAQTDGLARQAVGSNFREGLWRRIEAGEGTPEAVFDEPVPLRMRIRYLATGAAAAAALLAVLEFAGPKDTTPARSSGEPSASEVAQASPDRVITENPITSESATVRADTPWPRRGDGTVVTGTGVEPDMLARTVSRNVAERARVLRSLADELRIQWQDTSVRVSSDGPQRGAVTARYDELRENLGSLGNHSRLLLELKDNNLVDLMPRAEASLRFMVLQREASSSGEQELRGRLTALEDAAAVLTDLPYELRVPAEVRAQDMQRVTEVICNLVMRDPTVGRALPWLRPVPDGPALPFESCVQQFLISGTPGSGPKMTFIMQNVSSDSGQGFRVEIHSGVRIEAGKAQPTQTLPGSGLRRR